MRGWARNGLRADVIDAKPEAPSAARILLPICLDFSVRCGRWSTISIIGRVDPGGVTPDIGNTRESLPKFRFVAPPHHECPPRGAVPLLFDICVAAHALAQPIMVTEPAFQGLVPRGVQFATFLCEKGAALVGEFLCRETLFVAFERR